MKRKYLSEKLNTFNSDQLKIFNEMQQDKKLQICIPTGGGKNYIMMMDILKHLIVTKEKIFAIASHRLMLNNQHMNDMFELFKPMIGSIGYIFVGSSEFDYTKFMTNPELNKLLFKKGLSYNEIISSVTNKFDLNKAVKSHLDSGRQVVILTTYHSLHTLKDLTIDSLYCDEAHTLASTEDSAQFRENFESVTTIRKYFLTATPKDVANLQENESTEFFLMNNKDVFGKRIGLNFKECVDKGYMVKPVWHVAMPSDFDPTLEFKSIPNMVKFITEAFSVHTELLKKHSSDPSKIAPKILIKCPSVDDMWKIHSAMVGKIPGVRICAGASRNESSGFNHFIDNRGIAERSKYLESIQEFKESDMAIVLHYDTMSEGINVSGFTGVMFLGGKLPTIIKTLQNTGRATRLHPVDRRRFMAGEIAVGDGNWIKQYCFVIIPYWDVESEFTAHELAKQIKGLRDNFGYDPSYYISVGSDIGEGKKPEDMSALNKKDEKDKKSKLIEEIRHEIEVLDKEELDMKESMRLNSLDLMEYFKQVNGISE
jgi:hypothetical protein